MVQGLELGEMQREGDDAPKLMDVCIHVAMIEEGRWPRHDLVVLVFGFMTIEGGRNQT